MKYANYMYFMPRINNYIKSGRKDNLVEPTTDQRYIKTKDFQV